MHWSSRELFLRCFFSQCFDLDLRKNSSAASSFDLILRSFFRRQLHLNRSNRLPHLPKEHQVLLRQLHNSQHKVPKPTRLPKLPRLPRLSKALMSCRKIVTKCLVREVEMLLALGNHLKVIHFS